MNPVKILLIAGISLIVLAGVVFLVQKAGIPIGRLPGDIHIKNENSSFYFPVVSCLLVSAVISLLMYFFRR